jgi:hypothetical protein
LLNTLCLEYKEYLDELNLDSKKNKLKVILSKNPFTLNQIIYIYNTHSISIDHKLDIEFLTSLDLSVLSVYTKNIILKLDLSDSNLGLRTISLGYSVVEEERYRLSRTSSKDFIQQNNFCQNFAKLKTEINTVDVSELTEDTIKNYSKASELFNAISRNNIESTGNESIVLSTITGLVDLKKTSTALNANTIHSIDAAIASIVFTTFLGDVVTIHDSFLTPIYNGELIRRFYIHTYYNFHKNFNINNSIFLRLNNGVELPLVFNSNTDAGQDF